MGNKKKLINKGLIDLFPKDINTFIDIFAGSAVVSINVKADRYVVNDIDAHLYSLYTMFQTHTSEDIISHIENRINTYGLAKERTKRNEYKDKDKINQYKNSYINFRNYYNQNKTILDFYTLIFYSFSQQFRFNSKGEFNMPCGNDCFSETNKTYIQNGCKFFNNRKVLISCQDFKRLCMDKIHSTDFVYFDPPYLNTTATYNENGGWDEEDENELYKICENLNQLHLKWGMSNVFENKGIINQKLIDWCNKNGWKVFAFDKFTYMACGKGNSNAQEVFICNY